MTKKSYILFDAEIIFSKELWVTEKLSSNEKILRPKYMIKNNILTDKSGLSDVQTPFVKVRYEKNKISFIEAFPGLAREMPIFYTMRNDKIIISDNPKALLNENYSLNKQSVAEFLEIGYVTSDRTLIEDVFSLESGEKMVFKNNKIEIIPVFIYNSLPKLKLNYHELLQLFKTITEEIFNDLIVAIGNKQVILPLSAGYDSRFIAGMLKIGGLNNVKCYAWGRPNNEDINISKNTADTLGYSWRVVDYSLKQWKHILDKEYIKDLLVNSSNLVSISGAAPIPFFHQLKEKDNFNSVVITGHTIGKIEIPNSLNNNSSINDVLLLIMKRHLLNQKSKNRPNIEKEIKRQLEYYSFFTDPYHTYETWEMHERKSKFLANTNRYYEALGLEWSMPLLNSKLIHFWSQVPIEYKRDMRLYNDLIDNHVFKKFGLLARNPKKEKKLVKNPFYHFLKKFSLLKLLKRKIIPKKKKLDEYGFDKAFPYLYKRTTKTFPKYIEKNILSECIFPVKTPIKKYAYLARAVLHLILKKLYTKT